MDADINVTKGGCGKGATTSSNMSANGRREKRRLLLNPAEIQPGAMGVLPYPHPHIFQKIQEMEEGGLCALENP